jgi:hypothetical protein
VRRLSPFKLTRQLTSGEITVLYDATVATLAEWTARLQDEAGEHFPEKVTAFREGMAVHGRFGQPCPRCSTPVQRIVHGEHEVNYCPACQTEGRLLAESRALEAAEGRLAEDTRRARTAKASLKICIGRLADWWIGRMLKEALTLRAPPSDASPSAPREGNTVLVPDRERRVGVLDRSLIRTP